MQGSPLPGAEHRYDIAPCGLALASADGSVLDANATLCTWLGYTRDQLVACRRFQDLLTMGGRIFYQTHLQPLLRIQGSVAEVKLELRRQDASGLPAMVNIVERPWEGQSLLHIAVFVAEDRHRYERELLLQRQRAEELSAQHARDEQELSAARAQAEDRALFAEQLVGMVSHDIRNPLSVIQMSAVLIDRGVPPDQQKAALARVTRAVGRVQHIIGDLLDFTQARLGGGLSMRKTRVDLHQAIADAVAELAVAFPERKLVHLRSGNDTCEVDADRIVQAIGNLVANAATHGAPGRPIVVRTESTAQAFRIAVHNEGPAIPPELLPRLFEPMVRGDPGTSSKGVGLGLFIVRAIVRAHGGDVQAQSSAEAGTTFVIALPGA